MTLAVHTGDALAVLRTLPTESVHCCVTSPPYWGLRDYGVAGQIGLEETLGEFLARLVAVFEEVRRVLRKDGTLWVNMGDAYASSSKSNRTRGKATPRRNGHGKLQSTREAENPERRPPPHGVKPKDLIGQPWRLAFALQEAGWYLRRDIIWSKRNPMPESCKDRPITSHEYIFLLAKSRHYHYDHAAIAEPAKTRHRPPSGGWVHTGSDRSAATNNSGPRTTRHDKSTATPFRGLLETRAKRSVWDVVGKPYRGAHFATYPPKLIEPCILAGCPVGGVVLDPFTGSGTTGMVAVQHGRSFVGIELNPTYAAMALRRIAGADPIGRQMTIAEGA